MSPEVRGAYLFAFMAVLFHLLQENKPLFSPWSHLEEINAWIAEKFHTSTKIVLRVEIGAVLACGSGLAQFGEWAGAMACWVVLGIILFRKALAWKCVERRKGITAFLRFCAAVGAIAISVILITITDLRKPQSEPWSNLLKLKHGRRNDEKPPTLMDLFAKNDFANTMRVTGDGFDFKWSDGTATKVKPQVYLDFPAKAQFVGFYVFASQKESETKSFEVCVRLAEGVKQILDDLPRRMTVTGGYKEERDSLADLTFSGRVILYHEDFLSIPQKADIISVYKGRGFDVQFRGLDYLGDQLIAWHHQHDAGQ